jgi:hypothetical protein
MPSHPFTSFRVSSERSEGSDAPSTEILRCAQDDISALVCHPERSEGSDAPSTEILSAAKDDSAGFGW